MKKRSKDVSEPSRPHYDRPPGYGQQRGAVVPGLVPPTAQEPKPLPPVDPAKIVSGGSGAGIKSVEGSNRSFTLPEKVTAQEVKSQSFRYGGGRSAGGTKR